MGYHGIYVPYVSQNGCHEVKSERNDTNLNEVIKLSLSNDSNCLSNLINDKLLEQISHAITLLENCNKQIFVLGTGTSGHLARKLAASLTSVSKPTYFLDPTSAKHGDAGYLDAKSIVIFVSKSGNTEELVEFFHLNEKTLGITIAIVGDPDSFLGTNTSHTISFGIFPESDPLRFNAIVSGLVHKSNFTLDGFLRNHPKGALGKKLSTQFVDVMHDARNHPSVLKESATLLDGINAISAGRLGACFIVNSEHHLLGIFTDGDLRRLLQMNGPLDLQVPVLEFASTENLLIAEQDMLVIPFIEEMETSKRVLVVPVVSDSKLVGVIHIHDVVSYAVNN
jgi:arabinose-5-phosphate isomerase